MSAADEWPDEAVRSIAEAAEQRGWLLHELHVSRALTAVGTMGGMPRLIPGMIGVKADFVPIEGPGAMTLHASSLAALVDQIRVLG